MVEKKTLLLLLNYKYVWNQYKNWANLGFKVLHEKYFSNYSVEEQYLIDYSKKLFSHKSLYKSLTELKKLVINVEYSI